jgi:phosphate:Na+ symporter
VRRLDDVLDRLNTAIKTYLTALDPEALSDADHRRLSQVLVFATNLEAAADVVDRDVMGHAVKRLKRGRPLDEGERAEARRLLDRLAATVRAAAAVFMTEDARAARQLVAEKEAFRDIEASATRAHFAGLRGGKETAGVDLDLLRELKRVNGHLVAAAAYPVLEGQGELLSSRLRLDS